MSRSYTDVGDQEIVFAKRQDEAIAIQPHGVKYYIALIVIIRLVVIMASIVTNHIEFKYLTYQIYLLSTLFHILLLMYVLGAKCLHAIVFHILLPLVYGLTFSSIGLLCFLLYCNSHIVNESVDIDNISMGQLYLMDHVLHTLPFLNILVIAFMFGRYSIITPKLMKRSIEKRIYYDVAGSKLESGRITNQKLIVERASHLNTCQVTVLFVYGFYYIFAPCIVIFVYMSIFNVDTIYGKLTLSEPINDIIIFAITSVANTTLILVSFYTIHTMRRMKKLVISQRIKDKKFSFTKGKKKSNDDKFEHISMGLFNSSNVVTSKKYSDIIKI